MGENKPDSLTGHDRRLVSSEPTTWNTNIHEDSERVYLEGGNWQLKVLIYVNNWVRLRESWGRLIGDSIKFLRVIGGLLVAPAP